MTSLAAYGSTRVSTISNRVEYQVDKWLTSHGHGPMSHTEANRLGEHWGRLAARRPGWSPGAGALACEIIDDRRLDPDGRFRDAIIRAAIEHGQEDRVRARYGKHVIDTWLVEQAWTGERDESIRRLFASGHRDVAVRWFGPFAVRAAERRTHLAVAA